MSTVLEQMQAATLALACAGPIKHRLASAYREHLASIESADMPRDLADDLIAVRRAMVRERPLSRGEDAVQATVRKMSNEEAVQIAGRVVMLFGALCGHGESERKSASNGGAAIMRINRA